MKYNPGIWGDEEIIRAFVVHKVELDSILESLRSSGRSSNQHVLLVGPRGSGKTMLVRRVAAEVRRQASLSASWYPLAFGEEAYQVGTAGEFWLEAIFHLSELTQNESWKRTYEELRDEKDDARLRQRALGQLMDFADQQGKRILLIVENLGMLSEQLTENADWELRHTLQNEPRLMLLATAVSRFEAIANMGKAWFDLFAIHKLEPLGQEQCVELWRSVSGGELDAGRSRAVRILTGGNPRLLTILAEFAAKKSFRELMEQLVQLIDSHTEYFKNHLDTLGVLERKVFVVLLESWDSITARDIAQAARMGTNKASALLQRLVARGAVEAVPQNGRRKLYQAAERLYNVYYLMRRRGHPSSRVKAVVAFMVHFYEGQDLVETAADLAREACALSPDKRGDHYLVYDEIVQYVPQDLKLEIVKATPDPFFDPKLRSFEPEERPRPADFRVDDAALEGAPSIDHEHSESSKSSLSPQAWVLRGISLAEKGDVAEAEPAFRTATELGPRYTLAWAHLGQLLHQKLERYEEAEAAYRKALELKPAVAPGWAILGLLLHEKLERYEEAEESYRKALEVDPKYAWGWAQLGMLLHEKLERYEEAEESYRKALELDPEVAWTWAKLGQLLHEKLERYEEAEKSYRKAVEVDPKYLRAWVRLGLLLHGKLERYEEAEGAYRKALELDPEVAPGWAILSVLLSTKLERYEEAEENCRKAVDIDPKYAPAWTQLGLLLHEKLKRYQEAEESYRKAIEVDPTFALGWAHLGQLLHEKLERYEEAEESYRKAVEVDPEFAWGWVHLGQLLHEKLERDEDAEEAYRKAEELAGPGSCVGPLAKLRLDRGEDVDSVLEQAETSLRKAVAALDGNWGVLYKLVTLLGLQGKWDEALKESLPLLDAASAQEEAVGRTTDFLIEAAAAGHAKEALRTLANSAGASALEPLIVGLRLFLGEKPRVAKEILEVAQDVADHIRDRQLKRSQQEQEAAEDPVTDLPGKRPVRPQQLPG